MSPWRPESVELRLGEGPADGKAWYTAPPRRDAALAEFEHELETRAVRRGTRLHCAVGGDLARFVIVPWNAELSSPTRRHLLAQQCLREIHGETARDWTVALHPGRYGRATLACALDTQLLDGLATLSHARGMKLVSVQSTLTLGFNRLRREVNERVFWLVWIESSSITLLLMSNDEPLLVKRVSPLATTLATQLDREWFALGIEAPRCKVFVLRGGLAAHWAGTSNGSWSIQELPLPGDVTANRESAQPA